MPADAKTIKKEMKAVLLSKKETEKRNKEELAKLPKKIRDLILGSQGRRPNGQKIDDWTDSQIAEENAEKELRKLSTAELEKIFIAHRPNLGKVFNEINAFLANQTLEKGWRTTAFRHPDGKEAHAQRCAKWMASFITASEGIELKTLTPVYLAAWLPHLYNHGNKWGLPSATIPILAARISSGDKEGKEIRDILIASGNREHEIGDMDNHVIEALLMANDPVGWEWVEKLLLAAQREEGLRSSILSAAETAHPKALRRIFRIIVNEKLARFSAVAQFVNDLFGYRWDSASVGVINKAIEKSLLFLENKSARKEALLGKDGENAYLALWATATEDIAALPKPMLGLLKHQEPEMRYAAASLLCKMPALPIFADVFIQAYQDSDERVVLRAVSDEDTLPPQPSLKKAEQAFTALRGLFTKIPKKKIKRKPLIWPWAEEEACRETIGNAILRGTSPLPPIHLQPLLKELPSDVRHDAICAILKPKTWSPETRQVALEHLGSASEYTRKTIHQHLKERGTEPGDLPFIEALLTRKTIGSRETALDLIFTLNEKGKLASADRLLDSGNGQQRLAGLEILRRLTDDRQLVPECIARVEGFRLNRKKQTKEEEIQCTAIADSGKPKVTLENGLGLFDPDGLSTSDQPAEGEIPFITPAAVNILKAIDNLFHEQRKQVVTWKDYWTEEIQEGPLGEARFRQPNRAKPLSSQRKNCPLLEVWEDWYDNRPKDCRDPDGLELERAIVLEKIEPSDWKGLKKRANKAGYQPLFQTTLGNHPAPKLRYHNTDSILEWLTALNPPPKKVADWKIVWAETACSLIGEGLIRKFGDFCKKGPKEKDDHEWSMNRDKLDFRNLLERWVDFSGTKKTNKATFKRIWHILNWLDKPVGGVPRSRPDTNTIIRAYDEGLCDFDDFADHLIGIREITYYGLAGFDLLSELTQRKPHEKNTAFLKRHPRIAQLVDDVRDRVIEIELDRGEQETAASDAIGDIESLFGSENLIRVLSGLDGKPFALGRSDAKAQSLTTLVSKTFPSASDTPEFFCKQIKAALRNDIFPPERILQLAFHAPQWVSLIDSYLNWKGFSEAIYWFLAHMSYVWGATENVLVGTEYDEDVLEGERTKQKPIGWNRLILERTDLSCEERNEGLVDVRWFHRVLVELGLKRFDELAEAARFASTPAAAKRAKYIADVLRGTADQKDLIDKINDRKLKENVRLLGLLPLPKAATKRTTEIKKRYRILQDYFKYARGLSSLSKPDAMRAAEIGLENMASTAGYRDPMRMQWALEAESTKDLAKGYLIAKSGDLVQRMDLDPKGLPVMSVHRGEKALKTVPPKERKLPEFIALKERAAEIKKQAARTRGSLEAAMCRGEIIEAKELIQLSKHALLWPMLSNLVLGIVGKEKTLLGYPEKGGKSLGDHSGKTKPIPAGSQLRILHAHDLLLTTKWHLWQRDCLSAERMQPFKQIFRELYVPTAQEKAKNAKGLSRRYAGQQIQPRQAQALWASRGWHSDDGIWKAYPDLKMTAQVDTEFNWSTPAEVEGWTVDTISFRLRDEYKSVPLDKVPPRLFSETMRDCDLVVSVAHRGEVDPEASASTVEMRTNLIEETCKLLGLKNVAIKKSHALIEGEHTTYSIHLGSGEVHLMPGGHLWLVPVHAQHRGRIFLPFADDDPKTAEILSKVLLLSRDTEIKDPQILKQLRRAAK
ncbi:DUF4132 domain-containing protein [Akkermansiaceae bacterium]|nr:DUF4132 domain-containing protein [Akkermansiaceae bacterium]